MMLHMVTATVTKMIQDDEYHRLSKCGQDIRVTGVDNGKDAYSEELTDSSSEFVVATLEVMHVDLGQHSVVLKLSGAKWGRISSNDDKLCLACSDRLQCRFVAKGVFAGLDD
jgi:hypothetical protein